MRRMQEERRLKEGDEELLKGFRACVTVSFFLFHPAPRPHANFRQIHVYIEDIWAGRYSSLLGPSTPADDDDDAPYYT